MSETSYDVFPLVSFDHLPGELLDGITEAVASTPDTQARATVICDLVQKIYESARWVNGPHSDCYELASLRGLMAAALEHQDRMSCPPALARLSA